MTRCRGASRVVGRCPSGHNQSAGKAKSSHARPGNKYLKGALGIASVAAVSTEGTFWQSRYRRLTSRRGPMRALVAIEQPKIVPVFSLLMPAGGNVPKLWNRLILSGPCGSVLRRTTRH